MEEGGAGEEGERKWVMGIYGPGEFPSEVKWAF